MASHMRMDPPRKQWTRKSHAPQNFAALHVTQTGIQNQRKKKTKVPL